MPETLKFENDWSLSSSELKELQKFKENQLEWLNENDLKNLKQSLLAEKDGYDGRSKNEKSKERIDGMIDTVINAIDKKLSTQVSVVKEQAPVVKEQAPVVKEQAPVVKEQAPVVKEQAPVTQETVASETQVFKISNDLLGELWLLNSWLEWLQIVDNENTQKIMTEIHEEYIHWNKEIAKEKFKELLSDPKNLAFSEYDKKHKKLEKALQEVSTKKFKVDSVEWLKTIDNLEWSIIKEINSKLEDTKVEIEEWGKKEMVKISDYLKWLASSVSLSFKDNSIIFEWSTIDDNVKKSITNIIKESLPKWADASKLSFTMKMEDWFFTNKVKITDIDPKKWNSIEASIPTIPFDLTKEISSNTIKSIDEKWLYKVKVGVNKDWHNVIKTVEDGVLKTFIEKKHKGFVESETKKIKNDMNGLEKEHAKVFKSDKDSVESIKINENKLYLEKMWLGDLKIDGKIPKVSFDKGNSKYTIDINWIDDLVVTVDWDKKEIRDEHKLLSSMEIKDVADVTTYNEILKRASELNVRLWQIDSTLKDAQDNGYIDDPTSIDYISKRIWEIQKERPWLEKQLESLAWADSISSLKNVVDTQDSTEKTKEQDKKEQEKKQENLENNMDLMKDIVSDSKIKKDDLKWIDNDYLDNFSDDITFDFNSIKHEWDKVILNIDIDDDWVNEEFNKNINIEIWEDTFNIYNQKAFEGIMKDTVIPKIAKLSKQWSAKWKDENEKTFSF